MALTEDWLVRRVYEEVDRLTAKAMGVPVEYLEGTDRQPARLSVAHTNRPHQRLGRIDISAAEPESDYFYDQYMRSWRRTGFRHEPDFAQDYLERNEAEEKSLSLLESFLTAAQKQEFEKYSRITITAQSGTLYRIHPKSTYNVSQQQSNGTWENMCAVTKSKLPIYDMMLAQMLMLMTNEAKFLKVANRQSHFFDNPLGFSREENQLQGEYQRPYWRTATTFGTGVDIANGICSGIVQNSGTVEYVITDNETGTLYASVDIEQMEMEMTVDRPASISLVLRNGEEVEIGSGTYIRV